VYLRFAQRCEASEHAQLLFTRDETKKSLNFYFSLSSLLSIYLTVFIQRIKNYSKPIVTRNRSIFLHFPLSSTSSQTHSLSSFLLSLLYYFFPELTISIIIKKGSTSLSLSSSSIVSIPPSGIYTVDTYASSFLG
jgi:hypothetical protein